MQGFEITPDYILTQEEETCESDLAAVWSALSACSPKEKDTVAKILSVYLRSLNLL